MTFDKELSFSQKYVEALLGINFSYGALNSQDLEKVLREIIPEFYNFTDLFFNKFHDVPFNQMYHITDYFQTEYIFLKWKSLDIFILIGPFRTEYYLEQQIEKVLYDNRIPIRITDNLKNVLFQIPVCALNKALDSIVILNEQIGVGESFDYLHETWKNNSFEGIENMFSNDKEAELLQIKLVENRYRLENILMIEVASGNIEGALKYFRNYTEAIKGVKRDPHPVKNRRAVFKLVNTVLRKSAERAHVHPFYLDTFSANFTFYLDHSETVEACDQVGTDMIIKYCKLVQKHALNGFSPHLRKVLNYIHIHLYQKITLSELAEEAGIHKDYLASIFKKETGKTIVEYIREERIKNGCELLKKTDLSLQDVAFHLGYEDYSHFSKVFKKQMGISPHKYKGAE